MRDTLYMQILHNSISILLRKPFDREIFIFFIAHLLKLPHFVNLVTPPWIVDFTFPHELLTQFIEVALIDPRSGHDYPLNIDSVDAVQTPLALVINAALHCMARILDLH